MSTEAIMLFEFGADGGGAIIYRLPNNKVIEAGSSGGIMDEAEDPVKKWKKEFENWEAWWKNFTDTHQDFWIFFSPLFIHDDIKAFIKEAVENYNYKNRDVTDRKERWNYKLNKNA
ncbi:hypothetical protein [Ferruginibacter sp.]